MDMFRRWRSLTETQQNSVIAVLVILATFTIATLFGAPSAKSATKKAYGWGDSGGGRPSYTWEEIQNGALGNRLIFNTATNGVIGNEKNCVNLRENTGINAGRDNLWYNNVAVEDGKEYLVRLVVHNNSTYTAEGTYAKFIVPTVPDSDQIIHGVFGATNADPDTYWDSTRMYSQNGELFHLEYQPGSAKLETVDGTSELSDNLLITTEHPQGVLIGSREPNGVFEGCKTAYIVIHLKVVFD